MKANLDFQGTGCQLISLVSMILPNYLSLAFEFAAVIVRRDFGYLQLLVFSGEGTPQQKGEVSVDTLLLAGCLFYII